jgi:hypothetical protein
MDFGMLPVNGGLETKELEAAPGFEPACVGQLEDFKGLLESPPTRLDSP